ncbi:hypothetical protein COF68_05455 [Bacillus toyonensis]|uniref:hypothetical protein n=1 Tax=Bacillus toyonensis TaxID=155322 RepID=UPI000BFE9D01|nr:hypothetical protein [Bacillus toyonensis]PHE64289.1 hypothetical protein COF68_05455 [Bacillus toyonensis]
MELKEFTRYTMKDFMGKEYTIKTQEEGKPVLVAWTTHDGTLDIETYPWKDVEVYLNEQSWSLEKRLGGKYKEQ